VLGTALHHPTEPKLSHRYFFRVPRYLTYNDAGDPSLRVNHLGPRKKLGYDVSCLRKKHSSYKTRFSIWCLRSPFASLGLLFSEKNIIGLLMGTLNNTMFVSFYFLHPATELPCFIILTK